MTKDLRYFLDELGAKYPDDLVRISRAVSADQEPAALLKRLHQENRSPVLWFDRVGESELPVVVNCHDTHRRIALALGVEVHEINRTYGERLSKPIKPVHVDTGPVKDVIHTGNSVDLMTLPWIRPSANATAPYLGGGVLVAEDPESGIANLSFNRLMCQARNRLGFHAAPGLHLARICDAADRRQEALPVAIVIGYHPAFSLGTLAKVPFEVDEYDCAGGMLLEPVPLVTCETVPLKVPANAECILEGRVLPHVRELEGPYDEFTGYAVAASLQPVIEITCVTRRHDAIWQDIIGGSHEHLLMGAIPKESSQLAKLQSRFPFVQDFHMPASGGCRLHAVVAIGPHQSGDGKRVAESVLDFDHFLKHVYVVDDDIDIRDDKQVAWAMATRFQAESDMICQTNKLGSSLDPSLGESGLASKLGFDCTRKKDDFPTPNHLSEKVLCKMNPAEYITEGVAIER